MTITRDKFSLKLAIAALVMGAALGCNSQSTAPDGGSASKPTTEASSGGGARPAVTAEPVKVEGDTIKIGLVASQTGDQKDWGDDSVEGAKLYVDEVNAAGGINGKKIELIIGDSGSKAEQAKTATEKLLSENVVGIIGEVSSGNTIQIAKAAFPKAVGVVGIGATRTDLTNEGQNVVRVCYTDAFQGPVMAKFAYEDLGLRKVGIVTDNKQPYSQGLSASFKETFVKLGGEIAGEVTYETGQTDFSGQITEISAKNPDGLFLSGYFPEVGPMAQQIRAASLKVPLLGGDGWDSPQLLVSGGDAIIGSYFCNHYNAKEDRKEVKSFLEKWRAKHGGKDARTTMGALAYDAAGVMVEAIKKAKALDSKSIIDALNEVEGYEGVSGTINLKGRDGNPDKRALVVEVRPQSEGFQVFKKAFEPGQIK